MILPDALVQRLEAAAAREGRSVASLVQSLLDAYERPAPEKDPIEDFIGVFNDDVADMSSTVRETLRKKFQQDDDSTS